jgi:hypothetical protein
MAVEGAAEAERLEHGRAEVVREGHPGPHPDVVAEHEEAVVRVHPARAGAADRRARLEREPGGVREHVADGRPGRACRLVEVEDSLLGGDECRERGRRLRDRGPAVGAGGCPVRRDDALGADDPRRRTPGPPGVDLAQSVHGGRY